MRVLKKIALWLLVAFCLLFSLVAFSVLNDSGAAANSDRGLVLFLAVLLLALAIFFGWRAFRMRDPKPMSKQGLHAFREKRLREVAYMQQLPDEAPPFQQATAEDVPEGLSYAKLSYLDAEALKFWNGKRTDFEIPQYYRNSAFGRNVRPALARLLDRGYLALGDDEQRISLQKVPELRAILAERELKSSGTKKELVARLLSSLEPEEISELFPVNVYCITETGRAALAPYSLLDVNSAYSLGLSSYRLLQAREEHPTEPDNITITRLLSDDLQACSRNGDRSGYQMVLAKTARFMQGVGETKIALECNILAFFMWTEEMDRMNLSVSGPQGYYMAKNVEEAAQLCGCGFSELLQTFREVIRRVNPFSLGTKARIERSAQAFTELLGIQ